MVIKKLKFFLPTFFIILLVRCGAQTDSSSSSSSSAITEEVKINIQSASEIAILSGLGKGSSVYFPTGSLDSGTNVKISSTSAPSVFQSVTTSTGSSLTLASASNPIAITANNQSGIELKKPMIINLPYSTTNLNLNSSIDKSTDNICVFLKTIDANNQDELYIWKKII